MVVLVATTPRVLQESAARTVASDYSRSSDAAIPGNETHG